MRVRVAQVVCQRVPVVCIRRGDPREREAELCVCACLCRHVVSEDRAATETGRSAGAGERMQDAPEGAARVGLAELERREEALERRVVREQQVQVCLECVRRPVFFFFGGFS